MNKTTIEWTDYTWNPVTGCDKVSAGCRSCYAEVMAKRFWGTRKFTDVQMHPERLSEVDEMGHKLDGKMVFVCDVSDLFHDKVTDEFIHRVFMIISNHPNTIFQILTKRPERALKFFIDSYGLNGAPWFHFKNVWLGVSCENQEQANKRIPLLLQIPAAVRFLSCEPLIGPIDIQTPIILWTKEKYRSRNDFQFNKKLANGELKYGDLIHWVIVGGESGHMARPMHPNWVRSLRDQCQQANVPFFFKQWGEWMPISRGLTSSEIAVLPMVYKASKFLQKDYGKAGDMMEYYRCGKSKSGNLLDGRTHLEFPIINCQLSTVN